MIYNVNECYSLYLVITDPKLGAHSMDSSAKRVYGYIERV